MLLVRENEEGAAVLSLSYLLFSLSEHYIVARPYWKQQLLTGSGMNFSVKPPGLWKAWLKRKRAEKERTQSRFRPGFGRLQPNGTYATCYVCPGMSRSDTCRNRRQPSSCLMTEAV